MSEILFVATCAATTPPCKSWKRDSNPRLGIGISLHFKILLLNFIPTEIV